MITRRYVEIVAVFINNSSRRKSSSDIQPEQRACHNLTRSDEQDEELPAWAIDVDMSATSEFNVNCAGLSEQFNLFWDSIDRAYMIIKDHIPLTLSSRLLQPTSLSSSQFLLSLA